MNTVRRERMLEFIKEKGIVTLDELSDLFPSVSLMTIHRDLTFLQDEGFVTKIRGGAKNNEENSNEPKFSAREILSKEKKKVIAQKALPFLEGASSIFLDAGTTMMSFAKVFPNIHGNVVTNGPNIALELASRSALNISVCGGALNKSNLTLSGTAAVDILSGINIDTAFLAASGYSPQAGFTCGLEAEADIKQLVGNKAQHRIMLIDSTKIGLMFLYTFASFKDYQTIITDMNPKDLPEDFRSQAEISGVTLL